MRQRLRKFKSIIWSRDVKDELASIVLTISFAAAIGGFCYWMTMTSAGS